MNGHLSNETLHRYLDGDLSWEERQQVRSHVNTCAECRQRLEHLRQAEYALRQITSFAVPADFTERVMKRVRQSPTYPWTSSSVTWIGRALMFTGVLLLIVAILEAWTLSTSFSTWHDIKVQWMTFWTNVLNDPESAMYILVNLDTSAESDIAQTVLPLALALIALGGFIHMVRWITTAPTYPRHLSYTMDRGLQG